MPKEYAKNSDDSPVYETLQKIKDGLLDSKLLPKSIRQLCVEVLIFEGYQPFAIASLLKRSDRTIRRDVEAMRSKNALSSSPQLTQMFIGEFIMNARSHNSRLKQMAREAGASSREKIQAEFLAWRVYAELIDKLRAVGFLLPEHCQAYTGNSSEAEKNLIEMSEKNKEIERQYSLLGPMEKDRLIEKLRKDIVNLDKEIAIEEDKGKEGSASDNKPTQ